MLRNLLRSRTGRALSAASIGLATLSVTVAATTTAAWAAPPTPTITSLSPTSVSTQTSSSVTINGDHFIATGYTTSVLVGNVDITPSSKTNTQLKFASPAEFSTVTSESVKVELTKTATATVTSASKTLNFTTPKVPAVTAVSPATGPYTGGTSVTITGTGFTGTTAVDFGTVAGTIVGTPTATSITATSPAEGAGTVDVIVHGPSGVSTTTSADQFTYTGPAPAPTVTAVSPGSGPATGGTSVTITGTGFTGATAVDFGTVAGTIVGTPTATSITATSPAEGAGTVDVIVQAPSGTSTTSSADHFTFTTVINAPTVTGVTPNTGPLAGGSEVTIVGTNFTGASAVSFGGTSATGYSVNSATSITASSPAESAGTVDVTVTTPGGGTSSHVTADRFTYNATPSVTGLSPVADTTAGGTTITINGLNLSGATAVTFGSDGAGTILTDSATSVTATDPAGTAGTVDVTVTTGVGTTATIGADEFTYEASPVVPPASLIIGSGSATTYDMMDTLGNIFEQSPGCDLTNSGSSTNQLDLSCSNTAGTSNDILGAGPNGGEAGLPIGSVNPWNDYYANAPATGSGNGRTQVTSSDPLTGGPDGISAFNVSFARSSSYSSNADLNYVGYATDGVSWVSEACINNASAFNNSDCTQAQPLDPGQTAPADATPHWDVSDISKTNLVAIWNNTLSCSIPGVGTVTMDWRCLEQAEGNTITSGAQPIDCYTTQTASGTYSTWQGYLGFTKNVNPPCSSNEAGDPGDPSAATDHNNLTENTMGVVDAAPDAKWAIYFFSYGKFVQTCNQNVATVQGTPGDSRTIGQVQATCIGQQPDDVTQFGSINGVYANAESIQGTGDLHGISFPDPRTLYNAYGNTSNTTAANVANPATLNFIGAGGFLCRADMASEIDPNSGLTYRTEIENAIEAGGFFPLDINQSDTFVEGTITKVPSMSESVNGGASTDYYPASSSNQNGSGAGYCIAKN